MRPSLRLPSALVLLLALSPRAHAAVSDTTEEAKAHYVAGLAHLRLQHYERAIHEFEVGYHVKPLPLFLYNIGQVARLAGLTNRAIDAYEAYLRAAPKGHECAAVRRALVTLREDAGRERAAAAAHDDAPESPPPDGAIAAPLAIAPSGAMPPALLPSPAETGAPEATMSQPRRSRKALWITLGTVGGALIIGGVITAVVLTTGKSSGNSNLVNIDLGGGH
jgi:hypothetical protein